MADIQLPLDPVENDTFTDVNNQDWIYKNDGWRRRTAPRPWERPADWLPMPTTAPNQSDILVAVRDCGSNYAGLYAVCTGGYDVDWGDGLIENIASATGAYHNYDYADFQLDGTESTRGYKQAMIKITPTAGGNDITKLYYAEAHGDVSTYIDSDQPYLEIQHNLPQCTQMGTGLGATNPTTMYCGELESINIVSSNIDTLNKAFQHCRALQKVTMHDGFAANASTASLCFSPCSSLREVHWPPGSLVTTTSIASCFLGSNALQEVVFAPGSLVNVLAANGTFRDINSLRRVILPDGGLVNATTFFQMFVGTTALTTVGTEVNEIEGQIIELPQMAPATTIAQSWRNSRLLETYTFEDGAYPSCTDAKYMLDGCNDLYNITFEGTAFAPTGAVDFTLMLSNIISLHELTFPALTGTGPYNFTNMLQNNKSLQRITFPFGSLDNGTNFTGFLSSCGNLQELEFPFGSFDSITTTSNMFQNCNSCHRIQGCDIPITFSVEDLYLAGPELDEIYEALPFVTAQTITVTGNPGVGFDDPTIATDKGWTVTA